MTLDKFLDDLKIRAERASLVGGCDLPMMANEVLALVDVAKAADALGNVGCGSDFCNRPLGACETCDNSDAVEVALDRLAKLAEAVR